MDEVKYYLSDSRSTIWSTCSIYVYWEQRSSPFCRDTFVPWGLAALFAAWSER